MSPQPQATWSLALTEGGSMRLAGEFDCATTPQLRAAYLERTAGASTPPGDVDLTAVSFADSTLVHFLRDAGRGPRDGRPRRVVVQAGSEVERLLHLTRADQELDLVHAG